MMECGGKEGNSEEETGYIVLPFSEIVVMTGGCSVSGGCEIKFYFGHFEV